MVVLVPQLVRPITAHLATPLAVLGALVVVVVGHGAPARACAACACGDPTPTTMGLERPTAGRARMGVEVRTEGESETLRDDAKGFHAVVRTVQAAVQVTAPVGPRAVVGVDIPLVAKRRELPGLLVQTQQGLGDANLRLRVSLYDNGGFSPTRFAGVRVGARLPTSWLTDLDGSPAHVDVAAGTGAFVPTAGVFGVWRGAPGAVFAAVDGYLPFEGRGGLLAGPAATASLLGQLDLRVLSLRLGLDGKVGADDRFAREVGVVPMKGTGGVTLYPSVGAVVVPRMDWLIGVQLYAPVHVVEGNTREAPVLTLNVVRDL